MVSTVATRSPKTMVTAIAMKKASAKSGSMPRIVVAAAMATGRKRLVPASRIAVYVGLPWFLCRSISSTSTIAFLMSIPDKLRKPSKAMKPNGWLKSNKPAVTPMMASGTVSQIIAVFLRELKRKMRGRGRKKKTRRV